MSQAQFDHVALRLHADDHVAVLKRAVKADTELVGRPPSVTTSSDVPPGHKIALCTVRDGEPVRKYGQVIGFAQGDIRPGDHVHTHNLVMEDFGRDYQFSTDVRPVVYCPPEQVRSFPGYARPGGHVGTRNYIAVISSVNCSASVSRYVADRFRTPDFARDWPQVDGVVAFTHKTGCGLQPTEPTRLLQRVLAGIARHPNIGGCVLIGLGCEVNQIEFLAKDLGLGNPLPGVCQGLPQPERVA